MLKCSLKGLLLATLLLVTSLFGQGTGPASVPFGILRPVTAGAIGDTIRAALGDTVPRVVGDTVRAALGDSLRTAIGDSLRVALGDSMRAALGDSTVVSRTATTITGTIVEATATGTPAQAYPSSSGTANTFGSWVQYIASLSADSWICGVNVCYLTTVAAQVVVEVGTGGAASEITVARFSFSVDYASDVGYTVPVVFMLPIPIKVASGTRLAVRVADNVAAIQAYLIGVQYYQGLE